MTVAGAIRTGGPDMKHGEFINHVAERAEVPKDLAETLACETLRTLADRLAGGEPHDLASQLPQELKACMEPASPEGHRFGPDEFLARVASAADVDREKATRGVRAVMATVREAVTPGEFDDVVAQLPDEYRALISPMAGTAS